MIDVLKSRFGGSWDGEAPEIHGLVKVGTRALKVELLWVKATRKWQICVFEGGECVALVSGEEPVMAVAEALGQAR